MNGPLLLLGCRDFLFATRIETVARQLGWRVERLDASPPRTSSEAPGIAVVDLDGEGDPLAWVRELRQSFPDLPLIAFSRHDRVEAIRAAREAGATQVLARGAFTQKLPELLRRPTGDTMGP